MIEVYHIRYDVMGEKRREVTWAQDDASHDAAVLALWSANGYQQVAVVDTDDLEVAWTLTNNIDTSWSREPDRRVRVTAPLPVVDGETYGHKSSEVGDVFVLNGTRHIVASCGFRTLN